MPQAAFVAAGYSAATAAFLSAVSTAVASYAVSAIAAEMFKPKQADFTSGLLSSNERVPLQQPAPIRRHIVGRDLVSGPLFFYESEGPYLYMGILLADHEIDDIEKIIISGKELVIDDGGVATNEPFRQGDTVYAQASIQKGSINQGVDPLIQEFWKNKEESTAEDDEPYTRPSYSEDYKGIGVTTVVLKLYGGATQAERDEVFPGDLNPQFLVKGVKVFDPRDPSQVFGQEDTYKWSENPTLIKVWWWMHEDGFNASYSEIDWDSVIKSANQDDELVNTKDGTEKRYTCNGNIKADEDIYSVAGGLCSSNTTIPIRVGGKYLFTSGVYHEPELTLTDDDFREGLEYSQFASIDDAVNTLSTIMVHADKEYLPSSGPTATDQNYVDEDGQEIRETIELKFTNSWSMAYRIALIELKKRRSVAELRCMADLRFIEATAGTIIDFILEALPYFNGQYSCSELGFEMSQDNLVVSLELRGYSEDLFSYVAQDIPDQPTSEVTL